MDALMLARAQFGFTIAFHYIFPPLSIGLGLILVLMEGLYLFTRKTLYLEMARFWTRIFGLIFAMGVATGIVMEFEFGTNWSTYSRFVGDIFGSALAAEGIFAFFLESGFLALLLFGWDRISARTAFLFHSHGLPRGPFQRGMDRGGQFLAADARRLPFGRHAYRWGKGRGHEFLGSGAEPLDLDPPLARLHGRLAGRGLRGFKRQRLLPA